MSEADKGSRLSPHPIVAALAGDPASPRETIQLVGYLGKSTRAQHHRLYLSLALDAYVDVPEAAIEHHADVPDTELAHGGTRLWIDASAQVIHEVRQTSKVEARFLAGPIADEYLDESMVDPGTGGAAGGEANFGTARTLVTCPTRYLCPTLRPPCTILTALPRCPKTLLPYCPIRTYIAYCPRPTLFPPCTIVTMRCPTIGAGCPRPSMICPSLACYRPDFDPREPIDRFESFDPRVSGPVAGPGFGTGYGEADWAGYGWPPRW